MIVFVAVVRLDVSQCRFQGTRDKPSKHACHPARNPGATIHSECGGAGHFCEQEKQHDRHTIEPTRGVTISMHNGGLKPEVSEVPV